MFLNFVRLPPVLVVTVRSLRPLVPEIVGVALASTVVVVAAASRLDVDTTSSTIALGNVVVDVVARAYASIARTAFLATPRSNLACTAFEFARAERTMM
jgi:hypothetical protein